MAVEIKEIVVKAIIPDHDTKEQEGAKSKEPSKDQKRPEPSPDPMETEQLIQHCVNQVLKALEKRTLR